MRKTLFVTILVYCFFLLNGRVFGLGEKILTLGSPWDTMEKLQGITEAALIRPHPVLVLASDTGDENSLDLYLSFNEGHPGSFSDSQGRYDVSVSAELGVAAAPWSRTGTGAALFTGAGNSGEGPLVLKPRPNTRASNALFAPDSHIRDFSIEFWIYPQNMENGAQILSWVSSKPEAAAGARQVAYIDQRIQCFIFKNRFQWTFENFFFSPGEEKRKSLSLSGPPALPRTWSHHLIRFDADLGLLEYLVDGQLEALDYATSSGREGGEVYTPVTGKDSRLTLGAHFAGIMDEFRIYRRYLETPALGKYPSKGGRAESRTLDLGSVNSRLLKIEAFGGRTTSMAGRVINEYAGNGSLIFQDHSGLNFFIRMNNEPYRWDDVPWIPVKPGTDLSGMFRGRYIQIAADFYPSADNETTPYLAELRVIYHPADPPPPPIQVIAAGKDGAVELSWKASPSRETGGYLVYYGTARGEYFGDRAIINNAVRVSPTEMKSPIDAGNRTSLRIEGLTNGTLYYFAVASYSRQILDGEARMVVPEPGEFSREAAARPLLRPAGEG